MSHSPLQDIALSADLAKQIKARGLGAMALVLLEAGRPLALLSAQLLWLAQPVLALAWESQAIAQWARFLEEPGSIDALIVQLQSEE